MVGFWYHVGAYGHGVVFSVPSSSSGLRANQGWSVRTATSTCIYEPQDGRANVNVLVPIVAVVAARAERHVDGDRPDRWGRRSLGATAALRSWRLRALPP